LARPKRFVPGTDMRAAGQGRGWPFPNTVVAPTASQCRAGRRLVRRIL